MCKTVLGYKTSTVYAAPDLTLEQILLRRDVIVTAIAQAEDGYYFTLATPSPTFLQGYCAMSVMFASLCVTAAL